jgi:hypothetical protein
MISSNATAKQVYQPLQNLVLSKANLLIDGIVESEIEFEKYCITH